ncbi:MAG: hypothetical protein OXK80_02935 [Bdellovibrionales bacterium]|nr:hypothetical protein [Bdellovibrionales bacterium]
MSQFVWLLISLLLFSVFPVFADPPLSQQEQNNIRRSVSVPTRSERQETLRCNLRLNSNRGTINDERVLQEIKSFYDGVMLLKEFNFVEPVEKAIIQMMVSLLVPGREKMN